MSEPGQNTIDITGLDKAEVFAALYNRARSFGMGLLHWTPQDMTVEEARSIIDHPDRYDPGTSLRQSAHRLYFDYVRGRLMKVDLSGDTLDPWLYDRDNGQDAAACALAGLVLEEIVERVERDRLKRLLAVVPTFGQTYRSSDISEYRAALSECRNHGDLDNRHDHLKLPTWGWGSESMPEDAPEGETVV